LEGRLSLAEQQRHEKAQSVFLTNIGVVYRNLGQYNKALLFYQKALAIDRKLGDMKGEGVTLGNIGSVYRNLGQYDKALAFFKKPWT
jgi:tetratricopeptide (TPR) repeat protein